MPPDTLFSAASSREPYVLKSEFDAFQQKFSEMEAVLSQLTTSYADKITELEVWVDPYSNSGEAICNYSEQDIY